MFRNDGARWTIGTPSLYISRDIPCKRCDEELRQGFTGNYVPVDDTLPPTTRVNICRSNKRHAKFSKLYVLRQKSLRAH